MSIQQRAVRTGRLLAEFLGLGLKDLIGLDERIRHVRAVTTIGISVGLLFSFFNLLTPDMFILGMAELGAVVLLLCPAAVLGRQTRYIALAEALILAATLVILGALVVLGGVEGTGIFWLYIAPFLAFFLKGQRRGWWYSLAFMALVLFYFAGLEPLLSFSYKYSPIMATHFLLSLGFYTLLAAAFNQLRSRFEEQLQTRVDEKTADAKALLSQLQYLATHDALTGLPNRVMLLEHLEEEIKAVQASGQGLLICNLRLERLFELGNVLGTEGRDKLVKKIAEHLTGISSGKGLLARTGRDEFVIVYRLAATRVNPEVLRQFIAERQISVPVQGYTLYIEFTLGLAQFPEHSQDAQQLIKQAEQAMLQARKSDQQWSVYSEEQEQVFVRHHLLFGKLRDAITSRHLQVHYQPQIDLSSGLVVGAEALARWHDPVTGMVPPVQFIPVAEESGLIRPLTTWLMEQCLQDCAHWRAMGLAMDVSINLSALNLLDPDLLNVLQAAVQATGVNPQHVNLEITESCFMTSPERAMEVIARIDQAGFKLSIDDFGTGYSSLSYLKNLPIDELKIDQSFVRKLLDNPHDQAIVSSTIDLAHNFELTVVAEGIEDAATAAWLHARGCDTGQGYCYAKPMPVDALIAFAQSTGTGVPTTPHATQGAA